MGTKKINGGRAFPNRMEIMSSQAVDKIIDVTLGYLEDTGVKFDSHEQAYDTLSKAGCDISSEGMVKFPPRPCERVPGAMSRQLQMVEPGRYRMRGIRFRKHLLYLFLLGAQLY